MNCQLELPENWIKGKNICMLYNVKEMLYISIQEM